MLLKAHKVLDNKIQVFPYTSTSYHIIFSILGTRRNRWDETPKAESGETPGRTPGWAETPRTDRTGAETPGMTPTPGGGKRRSRWDETPQATTPGGSTPMTGTPMGTPMGTPGGGTPMMTPGGSGITPAGTQAMAMHTPTPGK